MDPVVRLRVLGGFALEYDGVSVPLPSARHQVLLAYLALQRGKPVRRQSLAFTLWPDSTEAQAQTNLRTLLTRLHAILPNLDSLLQIDSRSVAWHPAASVELDVGTFENALQQAESGVKAPDADALTGALEWAVSAYTGDLLPDCSDEWVVAERERLRLLLFGALEQLATLLEQRREYAAAIQYARRLVRLDRLNEAGYVTLMRLYSLMGSRASALRVYHTCASTLQSELGTRPGVALTAAYERLLSSETSQRTPVRAAGAGSTTRLVGRSREWHRMLGAWEIAATGQPRLLVLSGEAGIGKTRLAKELLDWASGRGVLAANAHCYAAEGDLAFAPVVSWLRSDALRPSLARLSDEWVEQVARLVPDLASRRSGGVGTGALTEKWQRQRLFEALARAVLSAGRPALLGIDDLQWCPRDTLDWLHFLLRFDGRARLLLVGTVRAEEVASDHPLADLLHALRQEGRLIELALGPLSQEETAVLAENVVGRPLGEAEAVHLYAETEGNPLFVVEAARAQVVASPPSGERSAGGVPASGAPVGDWDLPPAIHAVIARRLDQVRSSARSVLGAAAVIGRSFTVGLLERVARVDEDALLAALDELWQRRIVREHGPDAYDFTHDKLRSVAYAELSAARRQILHRRVAEALEVEHAADLGAVSGQLALHYERAGQPARAALFYRRAAAAARRLYANETAVTSYRQALALVGAEAPMEAAALGDELGEVLHLLGRYDEAEAEWQTALQLTPAADRVLRAHLYRKLGNVRRDQYDHAAALATYDLAEATLGSGDVDAERWWPCWAQIKLERMQTLYWLGQVSDLLALVDQVRTAFEQCGPPSLRARMYQATALALLRRDRYVVGLETIDATHAVLRALDEANDVTARPSARFQHGFVLLWSGALDEAEREMIAALALAQRVGDISLEGRCLTYLTVVARKRYDVEGVRAFAERSLRVATTGHMLDYVGAAHGNLAWFAWRQADYSMALSHGGEALDAWRRLPASYAFEWVGRWPLIGVALERGAIGTAVEHARVLLDERQQRPSAPIEAAILAAIEAADRGDLEAARHHLIVAADAARRSGEL